MDQLGLLCSRLTSSACIDSCVWARGVCACSTFIIWCHYTLLNFHWSILRSMGFNYPIDLNNQLSTTKWRAYSRFGQLSIMWLSFYISFTSQNNIPWPISQNIHGPRVLYLWGVEWVLQHLTLRGFFLHHIFIFRQKYSLLQIDRNSYCQSTTS